MDRRRNETDWREQSAYVTILLEQLEIRKREHGEAYVTPSEETWLRAHGIEVTDHGAVVRINSKKAAAHRATPARA